MGSLENLLAEMSLKCILMAEFADEEKFTGFHLNKGSLS